MSRYIGAKRKYSPDILAEAARLEQSGSITLSAAARSYGIPKTTLHDAVKGRYATNRTGPKTVLSAEEEQRLADWAIKMARIGYGRTRQELISTVKKILDEDGRSNPFKENRPGRDWYRGFVKRHPELVERSPMQLGKERAIVTPLRIEKWFAELQDFLLNEIEDQDIIADPSRLYNCDESGFPLCPKSWRVIAMKGAKNIYNCTTSNKTQITVLACVSAIGHYIKPMIVYPGERFRGDMLEGFEDAAIGRSVNGWMDSELFLTWLTDVFIPGLDESRVKRPVLLFVDGHSTHVSINVSYVCLANGIHVFCLLEHASHLIQPLDLRVFGVLKENWGQAVRDYQLENIPNTVTKRTFAQVFNVAWEKSATIENAIKAFKYAGLFPLDKDIVLKTSKMEPSNLYSSIVTPASSEDPRSSSSADTGNAPPSATVSSSGDNSVQRSNSVVLEAETDEGNGSQLPAHADAPVVESQAVTMPTLSLPQPPVATDQASAATSSPFSKYLSMPSVSSTVRKTSRAKMPKAITGKVYRNILHEKQELKEKEGREKKERKEERERKKKEKEEDKIRKQKEREEKKKKREEEKRQKHHEKAIAQFFAKRRRTESSSSDSSASVRLDDESDYELGVQGDRKCFQCEEPYTDDHPLEWIACNSCPRLFHRRCTDVNFDEMREEEIEMFPFDCVFC